MAIQSFKLPSGADLQVDLADFEDAVELKEALLRSLGVITLDGDVLKGEIDNLQKITESPALLSAGINKLLGVATSRQVRTALFKCASRATYAGIRITPSLFNDPEKGLAARNDYYAIAARLIEVNVFPFFVQAFSMLKTLPKMTASSPA